MAVPKYVGSPDDNPYGFNGLPPDPRDYQRARRQMQKAPPVRRGPVQTESGPIERSYDAEQYYSLQVITSWYEFRGDATAGLVIDLGTLGLNFPAKKILVKNTGLGTNLYFALGDGAAAGDNTQSIEVVPGETREFDLIGFMKISLTGSSYRVTVGV